MTVLAVKEKVCDAVLAEEQVDAVPRSQESPVSMPMRRVFAGLLQL